MHREIRACLTEHFEGSIPYTELVRLESELIAHAGVALLINEAITSADETKIEQIVNRVLKSKKVEEQFLKNAKNVLTSLFKQFYVRRSMWKDGLSLATD